jgi:hypothetical protein
MMYDGSFGGCAEKNRQAKMDRYEFDKKLDQIWGFQTGRPSKFPVMKKARQPGLTWKQLNQLWVQKWACCQEPPTPQGKCLEGW